MSSKKRTRIAIKWIFTVDFESLEWDGMKHQMHFPDTVSAVFLKPDFLRRLLSRIHFGVSPNALWPSPLPPSFWKNIFNACRCFSDPLQYETLTSPPPKICMIQKPLNSTQLSHFPIWLNWANATLLREWGINEYLSLEIWCFSSSLTYIILTTRNVY